MAGLRGLALLPLVVGLVAVGAVGEVLGQSASEVGKQAAGRQPLEYTGVNLAGGEFGELRTGTARTYGRHFIFPSTSELDYFAGKGVNIIRLPFRWEDMQPVLQQPLSPAILDRVKKVVTEASVRGLVTLLDPHNYARYAGNKIGSAEVPNDAFGDFWSRLAVAFRNDPRVWFGLMNEPHDMPGEQWLAAANAGIAAIRRAGATNLVLVPGNAWTGAHSWISSRNAEVMLKVEDPLDHYIFEVHQYLDRDSSGTKPTVVSETIGSDRLKPFTEWSKAHKKRALLGEFGAANNPEALRAVDDMLIFMEKKAGCMGRFCLVVRRTVVGRLHVHT